MHRGRIEMTFGDDEVHELGPGGLARVDAATIRKIKSIGDEPAVYLVAGGKDGYVGRDGKLARGRDEPLRRRPAELVTAPRRINGNNDGRRHGSGGAALALLTLTAVVCAVRARGSTATPLPGAPKCSALPADNHWNLRVDRLPRHPNSDAIVRSIGLDEHVHADFGSGLWGRRPDRDSRSRRSGAVSAGCRSSFEYAYESDGRRYPIPRRVPIEGGAGADGDRHVIVVDRSRCRLYELFAAYPAGRRSALARRLRRDLEPALEPDAAARLDLGRRRRAADPAGTRPLRRGAPRPHRPRAALHGRAYPARVRLPGPALRVRPHRPRACPRWGSACGSGAASTSRASRASRASSSGAQALRDDPGRQRLVVVPERRAQRRLGQRRPALAPPRPGERVRGGRLEPFAPAQPGSRGRSGDSPRCDRIRAGARRHVGCIHGRGRHRRRAAGHPDRGGRRPARPRRRRRTRPRAWSSTASRPPPEKIDFTARDRQTLS